MTSLVQFVLVLAAVMLLARTVTAQNADADALNDKGKELYKNKDYQGAAAAFREAIAIQPDSRYFFNLCAALEKTGDYDGALEACDQVYQYNPTDEQKAKTGQRAASIRQLKKDRGDTNPAGGGGGGPGGGGGGGGDLPPGGGGGGPGGGGPGGGGGGPGGGGGGMGGGGFVPPVVEKPAEPEYKWSVGGEIGPVLATSGDQLPDIDQTDATFALRGYADRLMPQLGVGVRFYLEIQQFTASSSEFDASASATLFGVGIGGYKHFKIAPNLFFTPAATIEIAGYSVSGSAGGATESTAVGTFGIGGAASFNYVIGGKHVVWFTPISFTYLAPGEFDNGAAFDGGTTVALTFGYSLRFTRELFTNVVRLE